MIKYFCDFCGKELKRDTPEAKGLAIGSKYGSSMEYYDICKDCLDKIYEMIEDKRLGDKKWKFQKILKNFLKSLDKSWLMCYNIYTILDGERK